MQRTDLLTTEIPQIRWPERYLPAKADVFCHNEITIAASPETIWAWLIRAESWPSWYSNAAHIHFVSTSGPNLRNRSRIRWNTFGVRITSKVLEFESPSRLGWDCHGIGLNAYHAWVLTPQSDGTTHVMTEETQTGWLVRLGKMLMPSRKQRMHQMWLEGLKVRAEAGAPSGGAQSATAIFT